MMGVLTGRSYSKPFNGLLSNLAQDPNLLIPGGQGVLLCRPTVGKLTWHKIYTLYCIVEATQVGIPCDAEQANSVTRAFKKCK